MSARWMHALTPELVHLALFLAALAAVLPEGAVLRHDALTGSVGALVWIRHGHVIHASQSRPSVPAAATSVFRPPNDRPSATFSFSRRTYRVVSSSSKPPAR